MNLLDLIVKISAKDDASAAIGNVSKTAQSAASDIQKAFDGVGKYSKDFDAIAASAATIGPACEAVAKTASGIGNAFSTAFSAAGGVLSTVGKTAGTVATGIGNAFQTAGSLASKAISGISSVFGTVASAASSMVSAVKSGLESIASVAGNVASAIGSIASSLGTVASAAAGVVSGITKSAVSSYADYEQLVGGVETLFGAGGRTLEEYAAWKGISVEEATDKYNALLEAQNKVMDNAGNAYYTSGMSANDYMDTATFLSASLIQSLAGDTVGAADMIETAMVDMSDNANKFGSDMTSIINAYKGFSKQNFTMLDNLKLGYGGTKGEMARLLNDANAIDSSILGEGVVLETSGQNILEDIGLDQMIKAIHVVQEQMDITGTTTKEAMTTIQGSVNMAKASWSNMMTAIADDNADFSSAIDNVVSSTTTALSNLIPRIQQSFTGIAKLIGELAPTVISEVPKLISGCLPGITDAVAEIIAAAAEALPGIAEAVVAALPDVVASFAEIGETLITSITETMGTVVDTLANGFKDFTGIDTTPVFNAINEVIGVVGGMLGSAFDNIDVEPVEIINGVLQSLANAISFLKDIVQSPAVQNLGKTIFSSFSSIGASLAEHMAPAVESIKTLMNSLISGDSGHIDQITTAVDGFTGIFTEHISPIIGDISESAVGLLGAFLTVGANVIKGIVSALKGFFGIADDEEKTNRFQIIAKAVGEIFGVFTETVSPIIDTIKEKLKNLFDYLFSDATETELKDFNEIIDKAKGILEDIAADIQPIVDNFEEAIDALFEDEIEWDAVWGNIGETVGTAVGVALGWIEELVAALTGDLLGAINAVAEALDAFLEGFNVGIVKQVYKNNGIDLDEEDIENLTNDKSGAGIDLRTGLLEKELKKENAKAIEEKYGSVSADAVANGYVPGRRIGENISKGVAEGITSKSSSVSGAVKAVLFDAEETAKKVTDSHSPSKKYMKLGGYMIDGLRLGWKNGMDGMLKEIRDSYSMMERLESPVLSAEMRTANGSALNRATADLSNALLGAVSVQESSGAVPVNLVVDGKTLATVMLDPLKNVMKQKGVSLYA